MIEIRRSQVNDEVCLVTCKDCDGTHSFNCPYTQMRWKQQGWMRFDQFNVPTPREVRESKAA